MRIKSAFLLLLSVFVINFIEAQNGCSDVYYLDHDNDGFGTSAVFNGTSNENYGWGQQIGFWGNTMNFSTALNNLVSFNYSITNTAATSQCLFQFYSGGNVVATVEAYPQNGGTINTTYNFVTPLFNITSVVVFSYWNPAYLNSLTFLAVPSSITACTQPIGYASNNTDCNDGNSAVNPGIFDICNTIDDNCDGQVDNGMYYSDADGDGYGVSPNIITQENSTVTIASDLIVLNGSNDLNGSNGTDILSQISFVVPTSTTYTFDWSYVTNDYDGPGYDPAYYINNVLVQLSNDNGSNLQSGSVSINVTAGSIFGFAVVSSDGGGGQASLTISNFNGISNVYGGSPACVAPSGYVPNRSDCNDNLSAIHPGATEICNSFDDDCDSQVDDGVLTTYYADIDGDGYGVNPGITTQENSTVIVTNNQIIINGADNFLPFSAGNVQSNISFVVPQNATYTFNWSYVTTDEAPQFDPAYYINNTLVPLSNAFGVNSQSGSVSVAVTAGSTFGFVVVSTDGVAGSATLTITNFSGMNNITAGVSACSAPDAGYVTNNDDCNDSRNNIHPGVTEFCNSFDDDCDGQIDEGLNTYYADNDGDGFGAGPVTINCEQPVGFVLINGDCNDNSVAIKPSATELCNSVDDDCDGLVDDGVPLITRYLDNDGDGYGNILSPSSNCFGTFPSNYVVNSTDCNDNLSAVNPAAVEVCNNIDDNCNAQIDEGVQSVFYADTDGDGFGSSVETYSCSLPTGFVANNADCNDGNSSVNPDATEVCNSIDDNCNGQTDEGLNTYYADNDGDGFGSGTVIITCSPSVGFVLNNTDCNDSASAVYPGAIEICNSIDDNCDTQIDEGVLNTYYVDTDGDGYGFDAVTESFAPGSWVLYTPSAFVLVGTQELWNGVSNSIQFVAPTTETYTFNWAYAILDDPDQDPAYYFVNNQAVQLSNELGALYQSGSVTVTVNAGDVFGFGINSWDDEAGPVWLEITNFNARPYMGIAVGCSQPTGYVLSNNDCDNSNAAVNPGATEICNNIDDNCDSEIDEGVQNTYYADVDGDGFGGNSTTLACTISTGYSSNNLDCNENVASINPGASEMCNSIDDNCNGQTDEGVQSIFYYDGDNDGFGTSAVFSGVTVQNYGAGQYLGSWGYAANFPTALNNLVSFNYSITNTAAMSQCVFRFYNGGNLIATVEAYPQNGETINTIHNFSSPLYNVTSVQVFSYWNPAYLNSLTFSSFPSSVSACTQPAGYTANNTDCNDGNAAVNPGAIELCNTIDDNCDSGVDDALYYVDADNDGYGNASTVGVLVCLAPPGYVANNDDCDDTNDSVYLGSTEVCNSIDDDCDTQIDEGVQNNYYADTDGDGYGAGVLTIACTAPTGFVTNNTDCSDTNAAVNLDATEVCNSIDDNCDTQIDEGVQNSFYADNDGDGFGAGVAIQSCEAPIGYANSNNDCNDIAADVNPGVQEICNSIDDNCDTQIDEGLLNLYYADIDGDSYGSDAVSETFAPGSWISYIPSGFVLAGTQDYFYGVSNKIEFVAPITETYTFDWAYAILDDPDQDPAYYFINDQVVQLSDEFGALYQSGSISVSVNAGDVFGFGINSLDDEAGPVWLAITNFNANAYIGIAIGCTQPVGYALSNNDCNNGNASVNPGATEICNSIDDNCDTQIDEGVQNSYYADIDGDGYGSGAVTMACSAPSGMVGNNTDCDDAEAAVHPGATEICNSVDDDCEGGIDETGAIPIAEVVSSCGPYTWSETNTTFTSSGIYYANIPTASTYSSYATFVSASNSAGYQLSEVEDFSEFWGYSANANGTFGVGFPTWSASATNGFYANSINGSTTLGTNQYATELTFQFSTGVTGVGGNFFISDVFGGIIETTMTVGLSDGTSITLIVGSPDSFTGFTSNGTLIESITINTPWISLANPYVRVDNLIITTGIPAVACSANVLQLTVNTPISFYTDLDGDGFGAGAATNVCSQPSGYVSDNTDCDDALASINSGATELCNSIDDDCDTQIDEGLTFTNYYADVDSDGYGSGTATNACSQPVGYVADNTDCDDSSALISPNATELCNSVDENCNLQIDEGLTPEVSTIVSCGPYTWNENNTTYNTSGTYYANIPGASTYNTYASFTSASNVAGYQLSQTEDFSEFGGYFTSASGNFGAGFPSWSATGVSGFFAYQVNGSTAIAANQHSSALTFNFSSGVTGVGGNFFVTDVFGNVISNTVNITLSDGTTQSLWIASSNSFTGYISNGTPITSITINTPWISQTNPYVRVDNLVVLTGTPVVACSANVLQLTVNTPVSYYSDSDGDGYGSGTATAACTVPTGFVTTNTDCNNTNAAVNPGATEVCNTIDDDCDTQIDEGVQNNYYADTDGDGFGAGTATLACTAPDGFVTTNTDCNNNNAAVNPAATEVCNSIDDDCDTQIDEGLTFTNYYADVDGDTYGGALVSTTCSILSGYVTVGGDCNDNNSAINPGGAEVCINSIDDDCDGVVNDGCLSDQLVGESPATSQYVWTNFFPSCVTQSHTLTGFTPSLSSQSICLTGEDKWHYFTATSEAVSIQVSSTANDILLELQNANGTMVATENAVAGLGGEILNFSGLTAGQIYKVGVRNYNSALGIGAYTICVKMLKRGGCDYGPGPYTLCQYFKAAFAGAGATYTFSFTGVSGPAAGNVYTRTQTSDICVLSNVSPALPYGSTYNVLITSTYNLLDGAGNSEIIAVPALAPCTMITVAQPTTALRTTDQCAAGPRFRGATVASLPWVCGATNWRWEFTELNAAGQPVGPPITVNRGSASNFISLSSVAQLQYGKTYSVRTAPIFPYTGTNYQWGNSVCMSILGAAAMAADGQGTQTTSKVEVANEVNMSLYPNPTHGTDVNINLSGIESENVQIRILDALGKQVWSNRYAMSGVLNTNITFEQPLANGLYFVEAIFNGEVQTQRLMVQK